MGSFWFSGLVYTECIVEDKDPNEGILTDSSVFIVLAGDIEEATEKLKVLGEEQEVDYLNEFGKTVSWKFLELLEVQKVDEISDGAEIHSLLNWRYPSS